jgi:hypothetical protein
MLRPVGNLPAAIYWRRRLVVFGALVALLVLLVLTVKALGGGNGGAAGAASPAHGSTSAAGSSSGPNTVATSPSTTVSQAQPSTAGPSVTAPPSHAAGSGSTSAAAPQPCDVAKLRLAALVDHSSYHVGDQPVLMLEATDLAMAPCVQDFGGGKVQLQVYNGESRVWGSNDCTPASGPLLTTLTPNRAVRVRVTWSGLSSTPGCKATRQRVGAGTYTLYASLAGHPGAATQFALT